MKSFAQVMLLCVVAISLTGCGAFAAFQERIGSAIERYCEEPAEARDALREYINTAAAPNSVYIACEGDNPDAEPEATPDPAP